ncbi:MAG: response regulator [Nannocystaceae bacterium]|nr:response regulator [Nannocystaceae bacterium]
MEALLAQKEREIAVLRAAIRASPAGILVVAADTGSILEWNGSSVMMPSQEAEPPKVPLEEMLSNWDAFRPDGTRYTREELAITRALTRGEVVEGEEVIVRGPAGHERWITTHAAPVYDGDGQLVAGVLVYPDITERKYAELRAERFQRMAELSPDFVGLWLESGETEYVNPAGLALAGLTPEQLAETTIVSFFPESEASELESVGVPTALEQGHWRTETVLRGPDASPIPVSLALMAHPADVRGRRYLSAVMRDLRPMRELESRLRQSQRLESIGRLAGGVAHDFNNLLTVIDNCAALVSESLEDGDDRKPDLEQVRSASSRAADLCAQLLSFARRQIIHPTTLHAPDVVEALMMLFRRTLGEDILIETDLPRESWPIKVDRSQLDQILLNLVVNARDAMPGGGTLTVEAKNVVLDEHYASTRPDVTAGEYLMIAVSDTGEGMSKDVRERIFEPFFTTKGHRGTGLGLATVFGAVRQNGGHIWLYSEEGNGTCFKIYWPRALVVEPRAAPKPGPALRPRGGTVLAVEDEPALLQLTARLLRKGGYDVLTATNGDEALEVARRHEGRLDLLLTDVVMPRMNGKQLASALRALRPSIRVLYVSGYTENTIVHGGILDTEVAFLPKPFSLESLLSAVSELLAER